MKFSANLGFLFTELSLPDAIHAAKAAGFDAVECHWPYETSAWEVKKALKETGLPMLGLNTKRGDVEAGDNGVTAIPGREAEARGYIEEAISYAKKIGCKNIHVMAGYTNGGPHAEATFRDNLIFACKKARGLNFLIEPLNHRDAPGYHLKTLDGALSTIRSVGAPNLKVMFDCYHLQIMQGDLLSRIKAHKDQIGHIQFAAVPDRGEPDKSEINYKWLLPEIEALGWEVPFGAEYKPRKSTKAGLRWLKTYKNLTK